jgi:hypothetical protein
MTGLQCGAALQLISPVETKPGPRFRSNQNQEHTPGPKGRIIQVCCVRAKARTYQFSPRLSHRTLRPVPSVG